MWRQFPRQIASDLRSRGLHIKWWLRGTRGDDGDLLLSSYELLEFLEFLPDESAFKTAAERGGRWPGWKQMLAESVNELYRIHSAFLAANSDDGEAAFDTEPHEFADPVIAKLRAEASVNSRAETASKVSGFESDISFE